MKCNIYHDETEPHTGDCKLNTRPINIIQPLGPHVPKGHSGGFRILTQDFKGDTYVASTSISQYMPHLRNAYSYGLWPGNQLELCFLNGKGR